MDMGMGMQFWALLPEILLLAGALAALLTGSFLPRERQWVCRIIAATALTASAVAAVSAMAGPPQVTFEGTFAVDAATGAGRIIICLATLLVLALGTDELRATQRESETYALLLLSALGAMVMTGTSDVMVLAVAFLLASIPLYALIGLRRTPQAAEAALKTYLLGALSGIALLVGATLLYGLAGGTTYAALQEGLVDVPAAVVSVGLVGIMAGLAFKSGTVPGHFWVPDASEGASVSVAAFLTTVPKIGAIIATFRLLLTAPSSVDWPLLVAVFAALSMTLGNFAAFFQSDVRRLLGWSTISQAGYLLLPVAVAGQSDLAAPSLLFYLGAYAVTNLTAFAVVAATGHTSLDDYRGLSRRRPGLAVALVISLLSLVGTPPTAVFVGKLTTFTAGWDGGLIWLVAVAALNTVASLFYYLRWILPAFQRATQTRQPGEMQQAPWATGTAYLGASAVLIVGMLSGLLLQSGDLHLIR